MSAPLAINMARGEDITFTCTHQTSQTDSTPVNITAWTIAITIKDQSGNVTITKSGTVTGGAAGTYTWPIAAADTTGIKATVYSIDIWRTDSGSRREMGIGSFTVAPDVIYGS